MAGYALVAFDEEGEVHVVPSIWQTDEEARCVRPKFKDTLKLSKAIKTKTPPQDTWPRYKSRVLRKCGKF